MSDFAIMNKKGKSDKDASTENKSESEKSK